MRSRRLLPQITLDRLGLEFEIGFYENVVAREPEHLAALEALANAYTRAGEVEEGLRIDRRLVELLPENAIAHYNLACSLSLAGAVDGAVDSLERAMALGYRDLAYLARDPDLENVRKSQRYRELIRR